jgi:hypothetical protein
MWADVTPLLGTEVMDIEYTPIGPANIEEVVDASIRLKGHVVEGNYELQVITGLHRTGPCGASMTLSGSVPEHLFNPVAVTHFYPDFNFDLGRPPVTQGDALTAIMIYKGGRLWTALMLHHHLEKPDEYKRIGLVSMQRKHYRHDLGAKMRGDEDEQVEEYVNSLPLGELKIV